VNKYEYVNCKGSDFQTHADWSLQTYPIKVHSRLLQPVTTMTRPDATEVMEIEQRLRMPGVTRSLIAGRCATWRPSRFGRVTVSSCDAGMIARLSR